LLALTLYDFGFRNRIESLPYWEKMLRLLCSLEHRLRVAVRHEDARNERGTRALGAGVPHARHRGLDVRFVRVLVELVLPPGLDARVDSADGVDARFAEHRVEADQPVAAGEERRFEEIVVRFDRVVRESVNEVHLLVLGGVLRFVFLRPHHRDADRGHRVGGRSQHFGLGQADRLEIGGEDGRA
jgi:hypothetical protein